MKITKPFSEDFVGAKGTCNSCGCQVMLDRNDFKSIDWSFSENGSEHKKGHWSIKCPSCGRSMKCRK